MLFHLVTSVLESGIDVGMGAIAPPGKIHQGKTHQNRARSGNDFHTKMTKVPNNDTLQEVFVVQK